MLELIHGSGERQAIGSIVVELGDLMGQFRTIFADGTEAECEHLQIKFLELLRQYPALVDLHLGASYCEAARSIRGHLSAVEMHQQAGTATASQIAAVPELRSKVGELERDMRRHLDAFEKWVGTRGSGPEQEGT
jgi:hypothetical protein